MSLDSLTEAIQVCRRHGVITEGGSLTVARAAAIKIAGDLAVSHATMNGGAPPLPHEVDRIVDSAWEIVTKLDRLVSAEQMRNA